MLPVVFILGIIVGTFGLVQILIVLLYAIPTNRKLHKVGFLKDLKAANRSDMLTVVFVGTLSVIVTWLVLKYGTGNQQNLYFGLIVMMIFTGRKQLKANPNNIADYVKSHARYIRFSAEDLDEVSDEDSKLFEAILGGMPLDTGKEGIGGFLLVYLLVVGLFVIRTGNSARIAAGALTNSEFMTGLTSLDSNLGLVLIMNMVMYSLIASVGAYLIYSLVTKSSKTPKIAKVFHIVLVATSIASLLTLGLTPALIPEMASSYFGEILIAAIPALIGTLYFSRSSRVANTFGSPVTRMDTRTAIN
jgi:hypothetical protein